MARSARLVIAGNPHLVMVQGHKGDPLVRDDLDRQQFLRALYEACRANELQLHAFALLQESFWMVATPMKDSDLGLVVQALGRQHVAWFNRRHGRKGSLWGGRFRATPMDAPSWLLKAMVWVESLPAELGLIAADGSIWPWSSLSHHLGLTDQPGLTTASAYWNLGNTPFDRQTSWNQLHQAGVQSDDQAKLRRSCFNAKPLCPMDQLAQWESLCGRLLRSRPRGRPSKSRPTS